MNGEAIDTAGYTVEWFMSDGGVWKPMSADYSVTVTPWSTSYAYMAVISGTGEYEGEFSLVVSCDTEAQGAFDAASPVDVEVYEGQGFQLSADIYYNGDAANAATGGVVRFYAAAGGTQAYLGEANVVNGVARLSLASASLPAGSYTVSAEYSGVSGVYAPALGSDIGTITILSATLNSGAFSLDNYTLTLGTENTITLSNSGGYIHGTDYTVSWQVSRDGGLTWESTGNSGGSVAVTPENNRWQVRAVVLPAGAYTKPATGFVVGPATAGTGAVNEVSMAITAEPDEVFEGESSLLTVVVTDETNNVPVSGGSVTLSDGTDNVITLPVVNGVAQYTVAGLSQTTTYTAAYSDASGVYDSAAGTVTVTVKSRGIEFGDAGDVIEVSEADYTAGDTIELTAPEVYDENGNELEPGVDFYYQWQYSTDYAAGAGEYTATWLNFSAPDAGDGTGKTVRVTVGSSKTSFRVVAMPYGDYMYPAQGLTSQPVQAAGKIGTEITSLNVRRAESGTNIFDGDAVEISARLTAEDGSSINEGYIVFRAHDEAGTGRIIGMEEVVSGAAVMSYTVYEGKTAKISAEYLGTDVYAAAARVETEIEVHSVTISVRTPVSVVGGALTAGTQAEITLPVVVNAEGTVLTLGEHYYIEWLVDGGSGWNELADPQYADSGNLLYTPANENSKLAAVVYPLSSSNYSEPAEGAAAGVVSGVKRIETTTALAAESSWYEGEGVMLTATVRDAGGEAVLDGQVEFYAQYTPKAGGDVVKNQIGSARLNKNGEAVLEYTLPSFEIAGRVQFFAAYMGTEVYQGSSSGWQNGEDTKSATIAFTADAAITIADGSGTILAGEPAVGAQYTLTAPEVYERDNVDAGALACGEEYYYIWEYSEDGGRTWEVVQSDITADGKTLAGAVFGTDEAEYRATAYPLVGSGTHYRYPATGISVVTNTNPTLIATATGVELGSEYTSSGNIKIYPTGRDVTIKATVTRADSGAPAAGVVKFYHDNGDGAVELGSMNLDPAGQAVLTVPAPAVGDSYAFYAEFQANEVFAASSSDKTAANAAVLNNTIAMEGKLAIYSGGAEVTGPEVGVEYVVKGASVDVAGESVYNTDVNEEHNSDSTNPYYRYEWQVSQDGGQTWTPVANAGDAADELTVTFDSVNTRYRLAAYPVTESGWTGPSTGVFSNEVGVGQANTGITITLQNADGTALDQGDQGSGVFEGGEIRVVVNVDAVSPDEHLGGTDGTVTLTVFRYDGVNGPDVREDIAISPAESDVDANGNAVFTVTLPAYSYDATAQSNQINFFAEFSGDDYYAPSKVEWQDFVTLKSAAITWGGTYDDFAEDAKQIAIYEGTDTTGTAVTGMEANQDYTLVLPAIYAGDISTASERTGAELENGVHYTVDWQRQLKGSATATGWETVPTGNGGDTLYVASSEVEYSYRAVVSPIEGGGYEFAMDVAFGTLTATNVLTSEPTESTVRTGTVTALEVSDFVAEDNGVEIAAKGVDKDTPFAALGDGEHMSEYEGETVVLTATVSEADGTDKVYEGNVYFYRYVDGANDELLNEVGIVVDSNGVAALTVETSAWDTNEGVLGNVDRYYAVYEGTSVFETSESKGADAEGNVTGLQDVYVRSTAIETPRIKTSVNGDNSANTTTNSGDLTGLPAAVEINFALIQSDGSAASGYSVTAADGRWLTEGEDYSIQWYREEATVAEGGGETYVDRAIDGATFVSYTKDANSVYQKFSVQLAPTGHMLTGAKSYHAVIGSRAEPVVSLDPGYTFTPTTDGTAVVSGVQVIDGAHYGDEVTLTATVSGAEGTNALPTGTVQFWYRTPAEGVRLGEPVTLTQKDAHENELVAEAELVVDTAELPFNIDRVGFSYSGDEFYEAYTPEDMYNESGDAPMAKRSFKLWSVQISNPAHEPESEIGGVPGDGYTPDYSDPKHYPDGVGYGDVTISVYEYDAGAENYKGDAYESDELIANSRYVLEVGDIYTKSGEKLEFMHDNSGDITVEWFKSEDGGETWSPLPLT